MIPLLTTTEAAHLLGVSEWTVRRRVQEGRLICVQQTKAGYLFTRSAIDDYLNSEDGAA